jgi:uncharacterized protein (TIGR03435 family)
MKPLLIAALALCGAGAQPPLAFEVASVKAIPFDARTFNGMRHTATPTGITMLHVSMGYIVRFAYDIPVQRAYELNAPDWFNPPGELQFDVVAKTGAPVPESQLKLMLRALLAERFHLSIHSEKKAFPVYDLLLLRKTPALRIVPPGDPRVTWMANYVDSFTCFSMAQLAVQLGPPHTSRPVVDKTGLTGPFDFRLDLSAYLLDSATGQPIKDSRGAIDEEPALVRALRDQLGLALKPSRALIDILVVDRVEKVPVGN